MFIDKATPSAYGALTAVSTAVAQAWADAGLTPAQIELLNMRCSQINGCGFCLSLHAERALHAGVTQQQLAVLPAWREARELFDDVTTALLETAELVTELQGEDTADLAYDRAGDVLTEEQMSVAIWAAITIGAFNRVSILSRHHVRARVWRLP
ncbi:carboxymuconolactone decarboxylase family protein [Tsukamurella soli]|uniref:Carboxymuconolactone decarboxylase family protein n=1 Tax=Tsukamurella soli TaxID=644556 RepID=A0ABP8KAX6_9ACTN